MSQASSLSDSEVPHWDYIRTGLGRSGRSLSENNFAKERRNWLAILLREVLQNALDAKLASARNVRVVIKHQQLDTTAKAYLATLIPSQHLDRFRQSVPHLQDAVDMSEVSSCLVLEDFGTSGLTGRTDDPEIEGKGENWNAFWFREGEGGKENSSGNGGAGQGKITYFSTSAIRTLFAYTVRADKNDEALFGASSFLRDYPYDGFRWKRDAYWGLWQGSEMDRKVLPALSQNSIFPFLEKLGLERRPHESGLSLVLPSPKEFDQHEAIRIVIAEFFVPIVRGDLVVQLGDTDLDQSSIVQLANNLLTDAQAKQLQTCTTKGYRDFLVAAVARSERNEVVYTSLIKNAAQLSEGCFSADDLVAMREALDHEQLVSVRIPLNIKSKAQGTLSCQFDVHLSRPFDLDQAEQSVIRRDLLIGEEPVGGGKIRQRARGLTLITDSNLSRLLLTAEEATHLRWNTRLPRLGEYYTNGQEAVALVRNATAKVLEILTEGEQKKDFKLLSKYFSVPGAISAIKTRGKKSPTGKQVPEPDTIPPAEKRVLTIEALEDGCRIKPATEGSIPRESLPIRVKVEFAYEGLDKDAFSEYDPLDFNLNDQHFGLTQSGCLVDTKRMNLLEFQVYDPSFALHLTGFDKNLRLRMRMNYEEKSDATPVDTQ